MIFRPGSPFEPLRHPTYRQLWLGALCLNIGLWMQTVTAGWLMVSLHGSPMQVGLIQTASTLPSFLLALPGGVISDLLVNRGRFLKMSQGGLALVALVTATLVASGWVAPWLLLCLTFAYGIGYAIQGPSWFIAQNDAVPPDLRLAAISLGSASFSSARAVGPALAGLLMAWLSPAAVFGFIGGLALVSLVLLSRIKSLPTHRAPDAKIEGFGAALMTALRYALYNRKLQVQLLRAGAFILPAAALWALLPLVARGQGSTAGSYGLLLGCMGVGAVTGSLSLAALHRWFNARQIETLAFITFAAVTLLASQAPALHWLAPSMVIGGMAWAWSTNIAVTAIQVQAAPEMRSRALAIYLLVFQGSMALGGWMWGAMAEHLGMMLTLFTAAGGIGLAILFRQYEPQVMTRG
ncbi:MAG: putative major facilitator superfamily transporter [Polaromonas sp.]|nr:putative major facilitator superfamily transporter [Polaromonas sp.]